MILHGKQTTQKAMVRLHARGKRARWRGRGLALDFDGQVVQGAPRLPASFPPLLVAADALRERVPRGFPRIPRDDVHVVIIIVGLSCGCGAVPIRMRRCRRALLARVYVELVLALHILLHLLRLHPHPLAPLP